ncbi:MAG: tRNA (adenosine(37)-N6)-dimethylallyltransferase MiaA [Candidatus Saccharibacteria bacterium]
MSQKAKPLVVILGETASGKSKVALDLAKRLDGEIICADSWTVRQELSIGTDKPNAKDRQAVPHHLLDVIDPCSDFTAAVFKTLALKSIEDVSVRGKLPILVGGSGLYIDSVIFDYGFLKPSEPKLREELNQLSVEQLIEKIHELGLTIADNVDQRNKRRLIRLIENDGLSPEKGNLRENTLVIGVKLEQAELKKAIENRVNLMISRGILSEKYGWNCEALKGVGYKQWQRYFEGSQTLEETKQQIISATNNLAKKQRTWFKKKQKYSLAFTTCLCR